uniref:Zona pellucida sperm-binding protein 3 n=1 Tax=Poecilia mexicana TaxID=48701 RepID=A0A3B3XPL0_9TELE
MFSGVCPHLALALKSSLYAPYPSLPRPRPQQTLPVVQQEQHQPELVNTVGVVCHPDSLEVVIAADMFAVGAPVDSRELRLGVEDNEFCRATATSAEEYRIVITKDSLVYANLLFYSPLASPSGVVHMDEAVIPVECHYERSYGVSSSSLMPTWIPFTSIQAGVETLYFSLKLMNDNWMYERGANVFFLGEPINLEASVRIAHHMGLRVFLSSCVATLQPALNSDPKYIFIENGCLVDSQLPNSKAQFLPRTRDDKLQLTIDAFKFHNDDRGQLYITCRLTAVPVNDAESPNKACTFLNGRLSPSCLFALTKWFLTKSNFSALWEQEARVGPLTILPSGKSGHLPFEELPSVIQKLYRPTLYGSHWRSGIYKTGEYLKGITIDEMICLPDLGKGLIHEHLTSGLKGTILTPS